MSMWIYSSLLTDAISSDREYENVQGLEDEGAGWGKTVYFRFARHLLAVKMRNYKARVIIAIAPKILLSMGICKAK